jgi:hypothetical protein
MTKIAKARIIFLVTFLVCTQWYFTMLSTQHALHNMTFKCPVCMAVNLYSAAAISELQSTYLGTSFDFVVTAVEKFYFRSFVHVYLSRAPPQF